MKLPVIHNDCIHFYGDRPCEPNKKYGVFCEGCKYFEKDENLSEETDGKLSLRPIADTIDYPHNFIIIKLDAVGDVLRTTSILPSIKLRYPVSNITWITKEKSYPIIKNNEYIDRIITADNNEELENFLNEHDTFDIAINLDSGSDSCEIMKNIRASVCYGYTIKLGKPWPVNELANEWYLMGVNDNIKHQNKKTYHKIIHEICGLPYSGIKPLLNITDEIAAITEDYSREFGLKNNKEFILINLGGGNRWQNKKWTKEGYSSLINELSAEYKNKLFGVIAGEEDAEFYSEVLKLTNKDENVIFLSCSNTIDEFIAIINLANKVLTSDSLGMHIAIALDKFTVVLVGPTSYTELDVFEKGHIIHSDKMECKCFYSAVCTEDINCMNTIDHHTVIKYLEMK